MKVSDIVFRCFILSEIQENCYVLSLKGRDDCVVVDPGIDPSEVVEAIQHDGKTPAALLVTHGHFDHIAGVPVLEAAFANTPVYIGEKDKDKLANPQKNLSFEFGTPFSTSTSVIGVAEGEILKVAGFEFKVLEIPGHSCGHVAYLVETEERPILFCGDIIFANGVGRTDFPDSDHATLIRCIREKIFTLPDETLLCSGHGVLTTVAKEKHGGFFS